MNGRQLFFFFLFQKKIPAPLMPDDVKENESELIGAWAV